MWGNHPSNVKARYDLDTGGITVRAVAVGMKISNLAVRISSQKGAVLELFKRNSRDTAALPALDHLRKPLSSLYQAGFLKRICQPEN